MTTELIFDTHSDLGPKIPTRWQDRPWEAKGQFNGHPLAVLAEIAARVCYDSAGRGRSTRETLAHILNSDPVHTNVFMHSWVHMTVTVHPGLLFNRPGIIVTGYDFADHRADIDINMAAMMEWADQPIVRAWNNDPGLSDLMHAFFNALVTDPSTPWQRPHARFLTFFIADISRVVSHELVRHHWWCTPSQRSGRYCDDSNTPMTFPPVDITCGPDLVDLFADCKRAADDANYELGLADIPKKQARSMSRLILPNGLHTELVFTAPEVMWHSIVRRRVSNAADWEIRQALAPVAEALGYELVPAEDGLGHVIA